jgi:hypothetical protein
MFDVAVADIARKAHDVSVLRIQHFDDARDVRFFNRPANVQVAHLCNTYFFRQCLVATKARAAAGFAMQWKNHVHVTKAWAARNGDAPPSEEEHSDDHHGNSEN